MMLTEIELNEKYSIYVGKYEWTFSKSQFLKRIEQNVLISNYTYDDTSILIFNCPEFDEIKKIGLDNIKTLTNLDNWDESWASKTWIYRQNTRKKKEYYHKHLYTTQLPYTNVEAPIPNDWTFVFYLQVPDNMVDEEGMIFFKCDDEEPFKYLPKEGDFVIFPGDLSHLVKSNPNSKVERISICGNISFNVPTKSENKNLL